MLTQRITQPLVRRLVSTIRGAKLLCADSGLADRSSLWKARDATLSWDTDHYVLTYAASTQFIVLNGGGVGDLTKEVPRHYTGRRYFWSLDIKNGTLSNVKVSKVVSSLDGLEGTYPMADNLGNPDDFFTGTNWATISGEYIPDLTVNPANRILFGFLTWMPSAGNIQFRNFKFYEYP